MASSHTSSYASCVVALEGVRDKCAMDDDECLRRHGIHTAPKDGTCECVTRGDSRSLYVVLTSGATYPQRVTGFASYQPSRVV